MKLIAYMSNGYPTLEDSRERMKMFLEAGVDIVEADFPSKDPYLDSEYLQKRIFKALENESNIDVYMDSLLQLQDEVPGIEYLVNIYPETLREIGVEKFVDFMRKIGQDNVLFVGNSDPEIRKELEKHNLYASSFVTREMLPEDLEVTKNANGFVYLQAFGDENTYSKEYPTLKDCVDKVRTVCDGRPIYCGIGIHSNERLAAVRDAGADGAFLGSIVLRKEDAGEDLRPYLEELHQIANQ